MVRAPSASSPLRVVCCSHLLNGLHPKSCVMFLFAPTTCADGAPPYFGNRFLILSRFNYIITLCVIPTHNTQVGEYIAPLLTRAREVSPTIYLKATAATFRESWRLVDTLVEVASLHSTNSDTEISSTGLAETHLTKTQAEDVVFV